MSELPTVLKRFERIIQRQVTEYIAKLLSPFLCGHRKGYSEQYTFMSLVEKWKYKLDKKVYSGEILVELSGAFDTINHELVTTKTANHQKPSETTRNHPKPSATTQNFLQPWLILSSKILELYSTIFPKLLKNNEYSYFHFYCYCRYYSYHYRNIRKQQHR